MSIALFWVWGKIRLYLVTGMLQTDGFMYHFPIMRRDRNTDICKYCTFEEPWYCSTANDGILFLMKAQWASYYWVNNGSATHQIDGRHRPSWFNQTRVCLFTVLQRQNHDNIVIKCLVQSAQAVASGLSLYYRRDYQFQKFPDPDCVPIHFFFTVLESQTR